MAYKRNIEIFEEAYEKKDAKSVVSYVARDGRRRYIAGNKNPDGGGNIPSGGGMEEVTWQELKDKRDNGQLIAGSLYRITDYNCTTTQENTRSAGHQFDIVLLALSEDKLAEEGWAMMNESNIYDVTFTDGVTKKCYLYISYHEEGEEDEYDITDISTLLGFTTTVGVININEENKTVTFADGAIAPSTKMINNTAYNYFQNSNLSAWKVWYCLDNDKSRFAWADDSVDESTPSKIEFLDKGNHCIAEHQASSDIPHGKTAWIIISGANVGNLRYTDSVNPNIHDSVYVQNNGWQVIGYVSLYTPAHEGTGLPNGRGVIYRLIDEFNNDCPFDFKNIQYFVVENNSWIYTFSNADLTDVSVINDGFVVNNHISKKIDVNEGGEILAMNILVHSRGCSVIGLNSRNNMIIGQEIILIDCRETRTSHNNSVLISCNGLISEEGGIYFNNKKVLTEE